jgi:hypothetical protein
LSSRAARASACTSCSCRSVCLGKYWRSSPLDAPIFVADVPIPQPAGQAGLADAADPAEHDRAVDPALLGAVLGDVGNPQRIGSVGDEPAVDLVRRRRAGRIAHGDAASSSVVDADDAVFTHEPLDPLVPDPDVWWRLSSACTRGEP